MTPPLRRFLAPLLAAALLPTFACRKTAKPVAEVEGQVITQETLRQYCAQQAQGTDPKAALEELVRMKVAWIQADRTGLLKSQDWQEAGPEVRRRAIAKAYLRAQPGFMAPTEESVRTSFLAHNEERHVAHLLVRNEQEALAARKRLDQGEAFEKVAAAVSVDPSVAQNKGDLGWITRNAMVPEFGAAVFAGKAGDLCGPFRSEFGWHVALVKECRSPRAESFEKSKDRLMAQAQGMALKAMRENALKPLRAKYPVKMDEGVLALSLTPATVETEGKKIVAEICGESISLNQLMVFIKESMGPGGMDHGQGAGVRKRFLELLADDYRLEAAADKAGLLKRSDVQASIWLAQHEAVLSGVGRSYLMNLKPADAELAAFLQAHPEKFRDVGAVKVYLLVAASPWQMAKAAEEARKGLPWKALVARHANQESTGNWDPGFLAVADLKKVLPEDAVRALVQAPLNTVVGPVEGPEGSMLFKIIDRKPGEILPLDQCREDVRRAYLSASAEQLVQAHLDGEVRKNLKVRLYPENLKP